MGVCEEKVKLLSDGAITKAGAKHMTTSQELTAKLWDYLSSRLAFSCASRAILSKVRMLVSSRTLSRT